MNVLVTNDDGVDAPGLHALAGEVYGLGHDVVVAAPTVDHSGFGAALGPLHVTGRVSYETRSLRGLDGVRVVAIEGPPALAALCGCLGAFGPRPDVVISGINAGANTGRAVLHSGTVGAALTAVQLGVPAVAVSLALGDQWHWNAAAALAAAVIEDVVDAAVPAVLNLNVPNRPLAALQGVCSARIRAAGTVQTVRGAPAEGVLQLSFDDTRALAADSDEALLEQGYITATLIRALDDSLALDGLLATARHLLERTAVVA